MTTLHKDLVGTNLHDPKPHTHTESEVTDLGSYADASHTHVEADITDLGSYLDQTAADLLYEPLGGGGIPHYRAWDDEPLKVVARPVYVSLSGSGEAMVIPAGAFVAAFIHGSALALYDPPRLAISRDNGTTWTAWDDDPDVPAITVTEADIGAMVVLIAAYDGGGNFATAECFTVIQDSDGIPSPP